MCKATPVFASYFDQAQMSQLIPDNRTVPYCIKVYEVLILFGSSNPILHIIPERLTEIISCNTFVFSPLSPSFITSTHQILYFRREAKVPAYS